jgi:tetratricopeptide (TPR) repeat protein
MKENDEEQYGVLRVELYTRADRNCYNDTFYFYADLLEDDGFYVNRLFPSKYDEYIGDIHICAVNKQCSKVSIESTYGNTILSLDGDNTFKTGTIGLSYASCEITIVLQLDDVKNREQRKTILERADELIENGWELLDEGLSDGADECACKAIDLLSPMADSCPIIFRIVLSDAFYLRGYICSKKEDVEWKRKSYDYYKQAERLCEKLAINTKGKVILGKYAQVERALGLLYKSMDDYRKTERYLEKAVGIYRYLEEIAPGEYRAKYADVLAELANAQLINENNVMALETCRKGIKVCQLPHDESEDEEYLVNATLCQEIVSLIYSDEKDYQEAINQGEKLIEMLHLLCQKNNIYAEILKRKDEWLKEQQILLAEEDDDDDIPDDDGRFDAWS